MLAVLALLHLLVLAVAVLLQGAASPQARVPNVAVLQAGGQQWVITVHPSLHSTCLGVSSSTCAV